MASATVLAVRTPSMTGTVYVSEPVRSSPSQRSLPSHRHCHPNSPVNSNMMTASDTVVLVTPANVAAAPIMAQTPGKTQLCPKGSGPSSKDERHASKMASEG